jgi:hypothetical protein
MKTTKKTPGVAFYGKVRIPTIGHIKAIDTAKGVANKVGGKLHIGLSGTAHPLPTKVKKAHAEMLFNHPVDTGSEESKNLFTYLAHLHKEHDEIHLVAGSDRAPEYRRTLQQWNGKADRSGNVAFNFKKWKVHEVSGKRGDVDKHPTEMNRDELERSVSASKLEKIAKDGDYDAFKAYHPGISEKHVQRVYNQIRMSTPTQTKPKSVKQLKEARISTPETEKKTPKSIDHKSLEPMLQKFTTFTSEKLKLKQTPNIHLDKDDATNSFGGYNPSTKQIIVKTKNRHPMDIFRTVAHELVHHKQNENGKLGKDIAKEGSTGSRIENDANAQAGKIMRWFAKANPEVFKSGYVTEGLNDPAKMKAIFLAGGPGSGKDYVMKQTLDGLGLTEINSDVAFEYLMRKHGLDLEMPKEQEYERDILRGKAKVTTTEKQRLALAGRRGVIINGTADDVEKIKRIKKTLEDDGYETMMVFVDTADEVSRQRNIDRGKGGNRKVPDGTDKQGKPDGSKNLRKEKWDAAQESKKDFEDIFGKNGFVVVDNSADLRTAPKEVKEKVLAQFQSVFSKARKFTQTASTNANAQKWTQSEIQKRNVTSYVQPRASSVAQQTQASPTPRANVDRPSSSEMSQARRLGLSYYGFGRYGRNLNGRHMVTHTMQNGQLVPFQASKKMVAEDKDPCWKGYRQYGMKKKGAKKVPNCVPVDEAFEAFMNEEDRTNTYKREEGTKSLKKIYTNDTPGQKIMKKKKVKEDSAPALGYEFGNNGVGPTFGVVRSPTGHGGGYSLPMTESVVKWMTNERTIARFTERYGDLAEQKLIETAQRLKDSTPRSFTSIREAWEAKAGRDMGTVPSTGKEEINERGEDSKGLYRSTESGAGLTRKGAKKYGIKTAVTTPPSKLDPDGKAAKRRKSFCARMGGMKGPMKDEKGRPTRKAMSLRRWNCEE